MLFIVDLDIYENIIEEISALIVFGKKFIPLGLFSITFQSILINKL